jgi:hypothetical protein
MKNALLNKIKLIETTKLNKCGDTELWGRGRPDFPYPRDGPSYN